MASPTMRAAVMKKSGGPEALEPAAAQHRRLEESRSVVGKAILDPTRTA